MTTEISPSSRRKPIALEWDIVVIGGALAGAATAFRILRRQPGLRVLIVEKSRVFTRVQDWDGLALAERYPEWGKRVFPTRHTATNHFVGRGYWDLVHSSQGRRRQSGRGRNFAYHSRVLAGDGFVITGDASAFIDPFYSPGMDWVAFSTTAAVDLLDRATRGEAITPLVDSFNECFPRSCRNWFDAIYRDKYVYMGDRELMTLTFRLDLGLYYLGIVSQPYRDGEAGLLDPPFVTPLSKPFLKLIRLYNCRFAAMGRDRMRRRVWGRQNAGHHYKFNSYMLNRWLPFRVIRALIDWALLESREGWRTWFSSPKVERCMLKVER